MTATAIRCWQKKKTAVVDLCQLSTSSLEASWNSRTVRQLSRKRRDAGKGKAHCNSIRTLRLRRVRKHGEFAYLCATRSLKWLVSVQIVCVYRAVSLCYVTQTCIRKNFVFEPVDRRSGFRHSKKKKGANRDVLVNEDMIGQWPPL